MQRPKLAGWLSFPTAESVQARRNDAVGEDALRGESPGPGTPRQPGEERSLQPNRKSPQAPGATPMRATANGQTVPGNVRDRPRASGAGRPGGRKSVLFKKRLATLREGDHARTKKSRARLQMELPQRCRRPACKDKQPKGRADYQHHGGVPGRRDLLYTRKKRKTWRAATRPSGEAHRAALVPPRLSAERGMGSCWRAGLTRPQGAR